MLIRTGIAVGIVLGFAAFASAQQQAPEGASRPAFEVASIKPNHTVSGPGGMGTRPGGLFTATRVTVLLLIRQAYRVPEFQMIGAPAWINSDRFDIEARAPSDPKPDTMALMIQSLLEDRFQLKVHRETRELPEYTLVIGKDGPKIKAVDAPPPPDQRASRTPPPNSGPLPGSIQIGAGKIWAAAIPLSQFITVLAQQLRRPVIDKTDLKGYYDIELEFSEAGVAPDGREITGPEANDSDRPSIFTALQQKLGLKVESTKGPVNVLVIDRVGHPSEN